MTWHNAHLIAHGFIGAGSHKALIPPAVVPVITFHISFSTLIGLTIKAEFSTTELGPGNIPLVARGNDAGYCVPHVSIPINNVLLPVTIALGGSKVLFGSSKVLINVKGAPKQCGCCAIPVVPLSLNMACNDPCNYPGDLVIAPNTVEVGMTNGDIWAGIHSGILDTAVSWVMGEIGGKVSDAVVNAVARQLANRFFWELAAEFGPEMARSMVRDIAENLPERAAARWANSLLQEGAKVGMERVVDTTLGATMGEGMDRDRAYDAISYWYTGESPANDPRIYSTDGPGVRTGGI